MNTNTTSICACPNCRKQFSVNADYFGQTIMCDACGTFFVVPNPTQEKQPDEPYNSLLQTELLTQILRAQAETNEHLKALSKQILFLRAHTREAASWISFFGVLTIVEYFIACAIFILYCGNYGAWTGGFEGVWIAVMIGCVVAFVAGAILFAFYCWALRRVDNVKALSKK